MPSILIFRFFRLAIVAAMFATIAQPITSAAENHLVTISSFKYEPEKLEIKPGDSVTWINRDIVPHTATAIDKSWDTGEILSGASRTIIFSNDHIKNYFCVYHPMMKGEV